MAIWNLGSINIDVVYRVPHLPAPGETLAATEVTRGLGGKGANMSVAAARAAACVAHIGAVGADGGWTVDRLMEYGVDVRHISRLPSETGHAIIAVDQAGENNIILYSGANCVLDSDMIGAALASADHGDTLLMQNETNGQAEAAQMASQLGLKVVYAAAPFDADAVREVMPYLDMLVLNAVEAAQLSDALGAELQDLHISQIVVTCGADGCDHYDNIRKTRAQYPAIKVDAVDTTGAGDTFTGYLVAGLDRDLPIAQAIDLAMTAAAIMVTRHGTADVIPDLKDIEDFKLA
ncbi:ribokinase [Pseudosulfitobacter koreensis]|uniref:Ribokinase n=1 Tax=Pseudosulfitobacter koreensis TaxID=2968472 RepID=A0ABT1YX74_9RHOB|nr:ribokinase [Pseudosulfitobacter koreense]MCR8825482.1 ribokinase [Pseudosulfitobacter koreense]